MKNKTKGIIYLILSVVGPEIIMLLTALVAYIMKQNPNFYHVIIDFFLIILFETVMLLMTVDLKKSIKSKKGKLKILCNITISIEVLFLIYFIANSIAYIASWF